VIKTKQHQNPLRHEFHLFSTLIPLLYRQHYTTFICIRSMSLILTFLIPFHVLLCIICFCTIIPLVHVLFMIYDGFGKGYTKSLVGAFGKSCLCTGENKDRGRDENMHTVAYILSSREAKTKPSQDMLHSEANHTRKAAGRWIRSTFWVKRPFGHIERCQIHTTVTRISLRLQHTTNSTTVQGALSPNQTHV
jgi:hypothetical protein